MSGDVSGLAQWRRSRIVVTVPAPAAGADWSLIVPAGHVYMVQSIQATLTTSVAVATREADLTFSDGDTVWLVVTPATTQVASLAYRYTWFATAAGLLAGTNSTQPIPELVMLPGAILASSTALKDAADQWSAVKLYVIDTTVRAGAIDIEPVPDLIVAITTADS